MLALALVGLPVTLAAYRERGVLRRFEAFGVSPATVIATQAIVAAGLILVGVGAVLVVAAPTYGIPHVVHPAQAALGLAAGTLTLLLLGIAVGTRRAQRTRRPGDRPDRVLPPVSAGWRRAAEGSDDRRDALDQQRTALPDPRDRRSWLGLPGLGVQLAVSAAWAALALVAIWWLVRRAAHQS